MAQTRRLRALAPALRAALPLTTLALALASLTGTACSVEVDPVALVTPAERAPLSIFGPAPRATDLTDARPIYTAADDDDAATPGLQIVVRVDVRDEAIETVELALPGAAVLTDVVGEDLDGARAAFFVATLAQAENLVVARAVELDAEAHTTLVAFADDTAVK